MGDHRGAPVDHEEVEPAELREIIGAILVAHGVVGLRAIVRVAEIVDDQLVALHLRRRQADHVGLPVAIVAGSERAPPEQDDGQRHHPHPEGKG